MLINYNDNYPRTAGGYSLETYEPAVINPNQRNRAEDLIKMTFSNKKPMATVRRIIRRTPQVNILPTHVLQNINYVPAQNMPVANIGTNVNGYQIINQAPNNVYRYNNFQRPNVIRIVKTNNSFVGNNPYLHQNLINVTNKYQLATKIAQFPINNGNRFRDNSMEYTVTEGFFNKKRRNKLRDLYNEEKNNVQIEAKQNEHKTMDTKDEDNNFKTTSNFYQNTII